MNTTGIGICWSGVVMICVWSSGPDFHRDHLTVRTSTDVIYTSFGVCEQQPEGVIAPCGWTLTELVRWSVCGVRGLKKRGANGLHVELFVADEPTITGNQRQERHQDKRSIWVAVVESSSWLVSRLTNGRPAG